MWLTGFGHFCLLFVSMLCRKVERCLERKKLVISFFVVFSLVWGSRQMTQVG